MPLLLERLKFYSTYFRYIKHFSVPKRKSVKLKQHKTGFQIAHILLPFLNNYNSSLYKRVSVIF